MKRFLKDCWNYVATALASEEGVALWTVLGLLGLALLILWSMGS
jgi:hypothetical protein